LDTTLFIVSVPRSTVAWGLAVPIPTSSNTSGVAILTPSAYGVFGMMSTENSGQPVPPARVHNAVYQPRFRGNGKAFQRSFILSLLPTIDSQSKLAPAEKAFEKVEASVKWVSCEPLMERITISKPELFHGFVIGGASKSTQTPEFRPPREWVEHLWKQADAGMAFTRPFQFKTAIHEFKFGKRSSNLNSRDTVYLTRTTQFSCPPTVQLHPLGRADADAWQSDRRAHQAAYFRRVLVHVQPFADSGRVEHPARVHIDVQPWRRRASLGPAPLVHTT
jgi:hypothetical protein